jgi:3-dehydroquinate synthase class II
MVDIESTGVPEKKEDHIVVEEIHFTNDEYVNSFSTITGEYTDFMMLTILGQGTFDDIIVLEDFYIGDTDTKDDVVLTQKDLEDGAITHVPSEQSLKKVIKEAREELIKDVGEEGVGYIYICSREDDEYAVGLAISEQPLRKATQDDWVIIT